MDWIVTCCISYYRCNFRKTKGCLATKKVQRSEEEHNFAKKFLSHKHTAKGSWSVKQWIQQHCSVRFSSKQITETKILEQCVPACGLDRGRVNKAQRTHEWRSEDVKKDTQMRVRGRDGDICATEPVNDWDGRGAILVIKKAKNGGGEYEQW